MGRYVMVKANDFSCFLGLEWSCISKLHMFRYPYKTMPP